MIIYSGHSLSNLLFVIGDETIFNQFVQCRVESSDRYLYYAVG